ncbi:MAG: c-type cytochrome biogenesis protein CcmI [Nitrosomonadales bacterium]|nr:c-type cytochrome biogenesis protein CcmI [Nitrosomonadales bacterium]
MTTFWMICALLLAVAVLFIVLPLWRSKVKNNHVLRDAANLEIFRDQIAEMDADLRNGLLTQELYDQGKRELQSRMLDEVKDAQAEDSTKRNPHKVLALVLAVLLPLLAVGIYSKIGNRDAFAPAGSMGMQGTGTVRTDAAFKELEDKIAQNPKDTESMLTLAHSYTEAERYVDAAKIYNQLTKIVTQDAQVWADFADVLAMANGQSLAGHPTLLINTALVFDPNNAKALALAGSAAMERGDYPAVVKYWEQLLKQMQPGADETKMIESGLQKARDAIAQGKGGKAPMMAGGMPPMAAGGGMPQAGGAERITGTVTLSDALKSQVKPGDMLFVLARAESGPPMPLAVVRKLASDLPYQFTLDDSMAMAPQMKLSRFDKVVVVARIAKSGDPMPHPGDMQGLSATIKPGTTGLKVVIDSVVK